jgi:gentisate 1,2-dioxygenase
VATEAQSLDRAAEEALYARLGELWAEPLWRPAEPAPPPLVPHVWRWREIEPVLLQTASVALGRDVERRVLTLRNPSGRRSGATRTLTAALQLILPGEVAPAHRHTMAALRWIIQGTGAHTTVEGERVEMRVGDLLLTPQPLWHDHAHEGDGPMIWLDGLDAPLVDALDARLFERFPGGGAQPVTEPDGAGPSRYGAAGLLPAARGAAPRHSPLMRYPLDEALAALHRMARLGGSDDAGEVRLEYVNPATGGHVMPTMACFLQLLRPGGRTAVHRHVSSGVYHVVRGSGHLETDGGALPWSERDTFAVPPWTWHALTNASAGEDAILFHFTDLPVYEALGLERREIR